MTHKPSGFDTYDGHNGCLILLTKVFAGAAGFATPLIIKFGLADDPELIKKSFITIGITGLSSIGLGRLSEGWYGKDEEYGKDATEETINTYVTGAILGAIVAYNID